MKSEKRHQLEQNALANWIAESIKAIEPYLKPIVVSLAILAIAFLGVTWWRNYSSRESTTAWSEFNSALTQGSVNGLDDVADGNPGTKAGQWAALMAADIRFTEGSQLLFVDRANATQQLNKAVEGYSSVVEKSREPTLRERALSGRARAYECLAGTRQSEGELDKAIADYEAVAKSYPDGPYTADATERVEQLKSPEAKKFYDRFAAYTPKPPAARGLPDLPGLFDSGNVPEGPGSEFSKILNLGGPGESKSGETKKESPKAESGKSAPPKAETPAATQSPKSEAAKSPEPAKTEPAKTEPAKAEPKK